MPLHSALSIFVYLSLSLSLPVCLYVYLHSNLMNEMWITQIAKTFMGYIGLDLQGICPIECISSIRSSDLRVYERICLNLPLSLSLPFPSLSLAIKNNCMLKLQFLWGFLLLSRFFLYYFFFFAYAPFKSTQSALIREAAGQTAPIWLNGF